MHTHTENDLTEFGISHAPSGNQILTAITELLKHGKGTYILTDNGLTKFGISHAPSRNQILTAITELNTGKVCTSQKTIWRNLESHTHPRATRFSPQKPNLTRERYVQSRLSYATLQGTLIKRSHMTGGLLIQSSQNNLENRKCMTSQLFQNRMKSLAVLHALLNMYMYRLK